MLRGTIELVNDGRIAGWLYSDAGEVHEKTILAFVDEQCVGAGRVDVLREDLKKAGLGHGRLGFDFPINVNDENDLSRVVVKLEGSDFCMLQNGASVARSDWLQSPVADPDRVDWMRGRGMLTQVEAPFLKYVQQLGAFDFSLVQPKSPGVATPIIADAEKTAQNTLELLMLRKVALREIDVAAGNFDEIAMQIFTSGVRPLSIVALWCAQSAVISVVEGSHRDRRQQAGFDGAIEYHVGPDRLLFVDLGLKARLESEKPLSIRAFLAE
jgi:hypothetical protein